MPPDFVVDWTILEQFRSLKFDMAARQRRVMFGITAAVGVVYWSDEYPHVAPDNGRGLADYFDSLPSGMVDVVWKLFAVRDHSWRTGSIASTDECFWRMAQGAIPSWPGFKRVMLTSEERSAVEGAWRDFEVWERGFSGEASEQTDDVDSNTEGSGATETEGPEEIVPRGQARPLSPVGGAPASVSNPVASVQSAGPPVVWRRWRSADHCQSWIKGFAAGLFLGYLFLWCSAPSSAHLRHTRLPVFGILRSELPSLLPVLLLFVVLLIGPAAIETLTSLDPFRRYTRWGYWVGVISSVVLV